MGKKYQLIKGLANFGPFNEARNMGAFLPHICYKRGEDYRLFYWTFWGLRFQRIFNIGVALKVTGRASVFSRLNVGQLLSFISERNVLAKVSRIMNLLVSLA